jgi:hypothetical protein
VIRRAFVIPWLILSCAYSSNAEAQARPTVFIHGFNAQATDWAGTADRLKARVAIAPYLPKVSWREKFENLVNLSINQTLSRTFLTSGLTFVTVVALFLFGGPVLHGFSFALVVGIIIGTYSSVFIASPIVLFWHDFADKRKKRPALAGKTFRCRLITPAAQLLDAPVTYASIPAWDGLFGVLVNRAPIVAKLGVGVAREYTAG